MDEIGSYVTYRRAEERKAPDAAAAIPPANGLTYDTLLLLPLMDGGADNGCGVRVVISARTLPDDGGGGNAVLDTFTCPYFSCKFLSEELL